MSFSIRQIMFLTLVVALGAAIGLQSSDGLNDSIGTSVTKRLAIGLFDLYLLACPILACYAYYRAAVDFRKLNCKL